MQFERERFGGRWLDLIRFVYNIAEYKAIEEEEKNAEHLEKHDVPMEISSELD